MKIKEKQTITNPLLSITRCSLLLSGTAYSEFQLVLPALFSSTIVLILSTVESGEGIVSISLISLKEGC